MIDLPDQPVLTDADDDWHDHSPHWWETETNWWSFNVPERKMGGWLYTQALAVQQTCNGGAWVWDDSPSGALYERNQHGLPFPVLTDAGCAVAEQFGLAYTIPQYHRDYYRSILVNIPFVNGDQTWRLVLPATYVLARDRRIVYAQAHADFRVRPEPEEVLAAALAAVGA